MSTASKSRSVSEAAYDSAFEERTTGMIAACFPLFDEMTKKISIPSVIYWVVELWSLVMAVLWSCWMENHHVWHPESKTVEVLFQVVSFLHPVPTESEELQSILICLGVELLVIGIVGFQALYFYHHRKFWDATLYPTRILLELCPLVINGPLGMATALVWMTVAKPNAHMQFYFLAFLVPLAWLFNAVVFSISSELLNNAAYISHNPFSSFRQSRHTQMFLEFAILVAGDVFFDVFPRWMRLFLIGVHIISAVYYFWVSWELPFIHETPSVIFLAFLFTICVCDAVSFVLYVTDLEMNVHIVLGIAGGTLVISLIVFWFMVKQRVAAVQRDLAYNAEINNVDMDEPGDTTLTDQEKEERLEAMNLVAPHRIYLYLLVGLRHACDLFIDWSLLKHCFAVCQAPDVLRLVERILIFFPSEYRQSNIILRQLKHDREIGMGTMFLMTQIEKIRVVRQSSASAHAAVKLKEMKAIVTETESLVTGLWGQKELTYGAFRDLDEKVESANAHCEETVSEFPNSIQHVEEYVRFLVECATDFSAAIRQRQRIEIMESGHSFAVDYSFKSMIRCFPLYLKKRVLDVKGKFIRAVKTGEGGSQSLTSNSFGSAQSSSSSSVELDAAVEESLARQLLTQSKTRLALQHALMGKHANISKPFTIYVVFQFVVSIGVAAALYGIGHTHFVDRPGIIARGESIDGFRLSMDAVGLALMLEWGNRTEHLDTSFLDPIEADESSEPQYVYRGKRYQEQAMAFLAQSLSEFKFFSTASIELANKGESEVYKAFPSLFDPTLDYIMCHQGKQLGVRKYSVKAVFLHYYLVAAMLIGTNATDKWYMSDNNFCGFFSSLMLVMPVIKDLRDGDVKHAGETFHADDKFLRLLRNFVPAFYAAVAFLPYPVFIFLIVREMHQVCALIGTTDAGFKLEAMKSLRKSASEQPDPTVDTSPRKIDWKEAITLASVFVIFAGLAVICVFTVNAALDANRRFQDIIDWGALQGVQRSRMIEMLTHIFNICYLRNATLLDATDSTTMKDEIDRVPDLGGSILDHVTDLLKGTDEMDSLLGVNEEIDDLWLKESCDSDPAGVSEDFHKMYRCGTIGHQLMMFNELMNEAVARSYDWTGYMNDSIVMHAFHLTSRHSFEKLNMMQAAMSNLVDDTGSAYQTEGTVLFVCSIALAVVASIIMAQYDVTVSEMCDGAMLFLRRCSPIGIVTNPGLLNYLLNQDPDSRAGLTTTGQIIHSAKDAIVCISATGIIDLVNQTVQQLLGFIPEQLLGQNIKVMISEKHADEIQKRLEMMVRHECPKQYKDTFELVNDSDELIMCLVDIMGLTGNDGKAIEAFVIIIRDVTSLMEQQQEAEIAKQKSEKLLYEILPRDIVNRINQGEKDITFVVPSATLMFIDIQKFSAYAADLTPQEIMGNLSLIFGAFDGLLPKYPLITKIKLIGDVYMCGAGLFKPEEEPRHHAEQMVRFALEALAALEDVNMKLNASLSVRIGVNTGGPIIAGVLGTDKPVFDIIGDPINIAARLQSTCLPNRVQISEETYHLLRELDFNIEPRGEVFLKGKGKRPAFLVVPASTFPFAVSDLSSGGK